MTLRKAEIQIKQLLLITNLTSPMKDKIQKLAEGLANAVNLLKEEKISEATDALVGVSEGVEALNEEATQVEATIEKNKTELATANEAVQKSAEEIKKYASLYIDADSLKSLLADLGSVKTMLSDNAIVMKTVSTKEDIGTITSRLEVIEKARDEKALRDETRNDMKKSAIAGVDLSPR